MNRRRENLHPVCPATREHPSNARLHPIKCTEWILCNPYATGMAAAARMPADRQNMDLKNFPGARLPFKMKLWRDMRVHEWCGTESMAGRRPGRTEAPRGKLFSEEGQA